MNQITLLGRVGKDPEVKHFENGSVAQFSIATDDSYKDKEGNRVERTDWHNVRVSGPLAKVVERYVKKGKRVLVQGKVKTRSYQDKDDNTRYVTEVHVNNLQIIDWPEKDGSQQYTSDAPEQARVVKENTQGAAAATPAFDDDLPF